MSEKFTISGFEFFSRPTRTRFPFRYGIASMTEVPHQFVRVRLQRKGTWSVGLAAEGLPPKWFTKNPATSFADDLVDMRKVIEQAAKCASVIGRRSVTFYEFWRELYREQEGWAATNGFPPLLANLGVSLCERAVLDALCRSLARPLHELIRHGALGLCLSEVHPELSGLQPRDLLPVAPLPQVHVRHTIGLSDPLTPGAIPEADRVEDGLPQDLETSIRSYGLRYFKIKLSGEEAADRERLRTVYSLVTREAGYDWFATVDGNENFKNFVAFRAFWESLRGDAALNGFFRHVLVVEQPVHRDQALSEEAGGVLRDWPESPPLIIDESDGALGDLERALALGYSGTSHKNCKGIVKGLANACLLEHRRRSAQPAVLTGEDLCNLGPVARLQDLALMTLLGIEHVERNGHHYYRGLSMWPEAWQETVRAAHSDLYMRHADGFVCVRIREGQLSLDSVNHAPFGCAPLLDPALGAQKGANPG